MALLDPKVINRFLRFALDQISTKFPLTNRLSLHQKVKIHQKEIVIAFSGANNLRTHFVLEEFQWTWYDTATKIISSQSPLLEGSTLQLFQSSWCTTIWSASSKAVTKADTGVFRMRNRSPSAESIETDPETLSSPRNEWLKRPGMTLQSWLESDESVVSLLAVAVALHSVLRDSSKFTLASSNLLWDCSD